MTRSGSSVARGLRMPLPILARKLAQRGRGLVHRLVADPASAWTSNGLSLDALRAITAAGPVRFFVDPAERRALNEALRTTAPTDVAATLRAADEIRAHRFDLLGSGPVELGEQIDWHRDLKSSYRWDVRHHTATDILDLDRPSDVRVVWELSRCHHWVTLGQAYCLTADARYAREFVSQWESWMAENPPAFGVNWTCAMEAAIRAVNWLWAFFLFGGAPAFDDYRRLRYLGALADHARFILRNLEVGAFPGNHYLTDGVGLLTLGVVLRELQGSRRWLAKGLRIVWAEVERQITPDGVDYERAIGYHAYVLQCLLFVASLCRRNGLEPPAAGLQRIERMVEFTLTYSRPDGSVPTIGDGDDGRLVRLGHEPAHDHRPLVAVGAALFGRPDFKQPSSHFGYANLWWLGLRGLAAWEAVPPTSTHVGSQGFAAGGFAVMRSADRHLTVSGAGTGPASHLHHDLLSFECWADGTAYVRDPGTYTYTASAEWRNRFRSTASHNTVMVDGNEQARLLDDPSPFPAEWDKAAVFTLRHWEVGDDLDRFDGEHTGYTRLPEPVIHRRQIWFDKRQGAWAVRDLLTGRGTHSVRGFLHLSPLEVVVASVDPWVIHVGDRERRLILVWDSDPELSVAVGDGWLSPRYGVIQPAPVVTYEKRGVVPIDIRFVLMPVRGGISPEIEPLLRWARELP